MSIMLDPEEVEEGYFTPITSTTLASIFKDDSTNDAAVNPSLKYRPPQPKKTEQSNKPDDPNASQCVFSSSIIAYEWVQGAHKCKGKVGFAMMKTAITGQCKIILYSPDKSTLSCTTVVPQLEVTVKGAMISLYDDHKKYWGLCFNDKVIDQVTELLTHENVIIKQYVNPEVKQAIDNFDIYEASDETDCSSVAEDNASTSKNDKASILNRIASVGHAILPSLPGSPVKKSPLADVLSTPERCDPAKKVNVLPDVSEISSASDSTIHHQDFTKSIAIQASPSYTEINTAASSSIKHSVPTSTTTIPLINNQMFTYINGYMVPLHMQVPIIDNVHSVDTSADIELIIHKLTHLKGVIKTMEIRNNFENNLKRDIQSRTCKSHETQNSIVKIEDDSHLKKISELELLIKEKDDLIVKLQNDVMNKTKNHSDADEITEDHQAHINKSIEQINTLQQDLKLKDEELKQMIPKKEVDMILANTVKNLMNNTFRSLASNFDNDASYTGNNVKAVLAAVIKKNTVQSLSALFSNEDKPNNSD